MTTQQQTAVTVRELRPEELTEAARLTGRGMWDNPLNVRAFGPDPERRRRAMTAMFAPLLRQCHAKGLVLGAFRGETLVGVCGMTRPGRCQPTGREKGEILFALLGHSLATTLRVLRWAGTWAQHDPDDPHWHVGPLAVDAPLRGQGLGRALMADLCARADSEGAMLYLETDKPENVCFYRRFGFETCAEAPVLGTPNWFMRRGRAAGPGTTDLITS